MATFPFLPAEMVAQLADIYNPQKAWEQEIRNRRERIENEQARILREIQETERLERERRDPSLRRQQSLADPTAGFEFPAVPEVQTPSTRQRIFASLADALHNVAKIQAGGLPGEGPYKAGLERTEAESRQRQQSVLQSNAAMRNQLRLAAQGRSERLAATEQERAFREQERIRQEQEIRDRQAEDDARDAAIADKKQAMLEMSGMAEKGWTPPDGWDLTKVGLPEVLKEKIRFFSTQSGDPQIGMAMAIADSITRQRPDLEMGGVSVSSEGKPSVQLRPKKDALPEGALTPVTARQAATAGVDTTGMTEAQALAAIATAKKAKADQKAKEREQRLNQRKGSTTAREKIALLNDIKANTQKALDFVIANPNVGGPVAGNRFMPDALIRLKDFAAGTDDLSKQYRKQDLLGAIRTAIRNAISGAAVSESEARELESILPHLSNWDDKVMINLRGTLDRTLTAIKNRQAEFGLIDEDLDYIENPNFVRSDLPQGMTLVGN